MDPRFEQFIQERKYLTNVAPSSLEWYRHSLRWLGNPSPTEGDLKDLVMRMRAKGRKATGCNCVIRAVNAYLHWNSKGNTKCGAGCDHLRVPKLKEPHYVPQTFTADDIKKLLAWRPKGFYEMRLHVFVLTLMDIGCRRNEAMTILWADVDFDNLLLKFHQQHPGLSCGRGTRFRCKPKLYHRRLSLVRPHSGRPLLCLGNRQCHRGE